MFKKSVASSSKGRNSNYGQGGASSSAATSKVINKTAAAHSGVVPPSPGSPETGQIPFIKTQDNAKLLPKYTAAINRPKNDYLPAEDLDAIQFELEMLLSSVALRYRALKTEYDAFEKEDRRDRKNRFVEKQPTSPGKRKRGADDKKSKDRVVTQLKVSKQKSSSGHSPAQSQHTDDSMDATSHSQHRLQKDHTKLLLPKNDTPNKFWLSVEPYCMPLTNEDLKLLDDLLEQYSGPLVPPIPELGPHYSALWAAEDIKEEQDNSNSNSKLKSRQNHHHGHQQQNNEATDLIKKGEKLMGEGVTGPLTQRLVSALMEENLVNDGLSNADSNSSSENTTNSTSTLRSLSLMKNGISIEKRVKKELIEHGLLDPDDFEKGQEDEILSEIKRVLAELSAIAEYNGNELRRLHSEAKSELKRLEIKRKLDSIDHEIIETYKKILIAKQKRKPLTTEEQDEVYRLVEEQNRLSEQLENMPAPGPNFTE